MKRLTVAVYGLFGTFAPAAGLIAFAAPAVALPPDAVRPLILRLTRELSSAFVFIGLMLFWCIRQFSQRRPVQMAVLVFIAPFAGVHWQDYFADRLDLISPLLNSAPVALLSITAPLGRG